MKIKVSIIIPVYNTEKYLKRCIESVIKQSLKEIEIIIINDGSPDKSQKIIDKYKAIDSRIKSFYKQNGGVASARNKGLIEAKGEYILQIDSDDWIKEECIMDMYKKAKELNLDILISDYILDYENGNEKYVKDLEIQENKIINTNEYIKLFFESKITPAIWNKLYKREIYMKNNILYPEHVSLGEDLATTPLVALVSERIGKINKAYLHYVQNNKSIMNSNPMKKIFELVEAFNILEKNINNKNLMKKKWIHLSEIIYHPNYNLREENVLKGWDYYIELSKKVQKENMPNLKFKIYLKILNLFPNRQTMKVLYYFNKLGIKLKNINKR